MSFFTTFTQLNTITVTDVVSLYKVFVVIGASGGAVSSGLYKFSQILQEPHRDMSNPIIDYPLTTTYHMTRLAFWTGAGATIGGIAAATAPISIPAYMYYKKTL